MWEILRKITEFLLKSNLTEKHGIKNRKLSNKKINKDLMQFKNNEKK